MDGNQYVFGVTDHGGQARMYLRIKAAEGFAELPGGYGERREEYPDSTVTHRYCVERELKRVEDTYFYTWYLLREYSRTVDFSPAAMAAAKAVDLAQRDTDEMNVDQEYRLTLLELGVTDM